jgi:GTP-binding protein Era
VKAGFVTLLGRPNAGKSTLLNAFVGQKLAIISDKPQTTRYRILGVRNREDAQIVFLDTPGLHKPKHRMNQRMVDTAMETLRGVDVVVLVVDATVAPGTGDRFVLDVVRKAGAPAILALNKVDLIRKPDLLPLLDQYSRAFEFRAQVPVSALTGDGCDALESEIVAVLPEGEPRFDQDYLTDQTERGLAAELIREQVLRNTRNELPYMTAVVIDRFEEPTSPRAVTRIYASVLVDRQSQKPIVLGRGGAMIKRIGVEARRELEAMLGGKVHLDLHVKVRRDWRDNPRLLDEMGLGDRRS